MPELFFRPRVVAANDGPNAYLIWRLCREYR